MSEPSVDPELDEAVQLYRAFMEEIKVRLDTVAEIVSSIKAGPKSDRDFLRAEFGFLQVRLSCDLIALSVLIVHKPYGLSDELMESWHARRALNDVMELYPLSFPRPAQVTRKGTEVTVNMDDTGALKRRDLQRIYDKCGKLLHRGALKHILGHGRAYDIDALERWAAKIGKLLSNHILVIPEKGIAIVTQITNGPDGAVTTHLAVGDGPAVYVPPETPKPAGGNSG